MPVCHGEACPRPAEWQPEPRGTLAGKEEDTLQTLGHRACGWPLPGPSGTMATAEVPVPPRVYV